MKYLARMASHGKYHRRIAFVAVQQELLLHGPRAELLLEDECLQMALEKLASDHIPGVRIGVARLIKLVCDKYYSAEKPQWILSTIGTLSRDESKDVRAFVATTSQPLSTIPNPSGVHGLRSDSVATSPQHTFSRPPPPTATPSIEVEMAPMGPKPTPSWDGCNHADAAPSPKSSLSTLKNGYDHETKGVTSKPKDGVGRSALSPRTKNGRVSR